MPQSQAAETAISGIVPSSLRWRDADLRISLIFSVKVLQQIEEITTHPAGHAVGILLGTRNSGSRTTISVTNAVLIGTGPDRVPPFRPEVREQIGRWLTAGAGIRISCVGLFILRNSPAGLHDAAHLRSVAAIFSEWTPVVIISAGQGVPAATVCAWRPAEFVINDTGLRFPMSLLALAHDSYRPFTPEYENPASLLSGDIPGDEMGPAKVTAVRKKRNLSFGALITAIVLVTVTIIALAVGAQTRWRFWADRVAGPIVQPELQPDRRTGDLGLEVSRNRTDLSIRWNRKAPRVLEAQSGKLQIQDGQQKIEIPLTSAHLSTGQVLYGPRSHDVEITLRLDVPSGPVLESVRVIQSLGAAEDNWGGNSSSNGRSARIRLPQSGTSGLSGNTDAGRFLTGPVTARGGLPKPVPPDRREDVRAPSTDRPAATTNPVDTGTNSRIDATDRSQVSPAEAGSGSSSDRAPAEQPTVELRALQLRPNIVTLPQFSTHSGSPPEVQKNTAEPVQVQPQARPQDTVEAQSKARIATEPPAVRPDEVQERRIGQPTITPPVLMGSGAITSPPAAILKLIQHSMVVEYKLFIDETGRVIKTEQIGPEPVTKFLATFLQNNLAQWRFQPARLNGKPVPAEHIARIKLEPHR